MYKSIPDEIKKIQLDSSLYAIHKKGLEKSDFGMDNTPALLEGGFGLYTTRDLTKSIGPIKTEYFRISLTRHGQANFNIGLENYLPKRNSIMFGFPGQIFLFQDPSEDFFAYYMLFSEKFLPEAFHAKEKRLQFPFLTYEGVQCFDLTEETAMEIEGLIHKMNEEIKSRKADAKEVICLYIQLILIHANRNYGSMLLSKQGSTTNAQNLFNNYVKLVSQHFLTARKVSDYANMLHVTPDHLNRAIKSCAAKTAHELIDEMVLIEAKAYLLHSKLSISEIAYQLEFADPSHFNKFFKKLSNCTPLEFRNQSE